MSCQQYEHYAQVRKIKRIRISNQFFMFHQMFIFSPCSRAMEAERIPRSRFKTVNADSHSDIIRVTEEGPSDVSEEPKARAACESRRFRRLPKNCFK